MAEGALAPSRKKRAIEAAGAYRDILGPDNFFLEMQWHGIEEQRLVNSGLPAIARDLNLPLVCTNDVHYLRESDAHAHDILLCIGTGKAFSDPKRLRYDGGGSSLLKSRRRNGRYLQGFSRRPSRTDGPRSRSAASVHARGRRLPPAELRRCRPTSPLDDYFEHVAREGFKQRLIRLQQLAAAGVLRHTIDEYERALLYEIEMIKRMKYPQYFLIVWDFIRRAREQGIPVGPRAGRGSAPWRATAGAITDVDPIDFGLIFERFLNPERVSAARYRHRLLPSGGEAR